MKNRARGVRRSADRRKADGVGGDSGPGPRGLSPGVATGLASLVGYQSGSIVSRAILDTREGTITLFAFDEGEGLSEHRAPYDALLHVLEGEALVTIAGKESRVRPGEAIILPAGKPHAVRASVRFKMLLTMIRSATPA